MKIETIYEPGKKKGTRVRRIRSSDITSFAFTRSLFSVSLVVYEKGSPTPLLIDMTPEDAIEVAKRLAQTAQEKLAATSKPSATACTSGEGTLPTPPVASP